MGHFMPLPESRTFLSRYILPDFIPLREIVTELRPKLRTPALKRQGELMS